MTKNVRNLTIYECCLKNFFTKVTHEELYGIAKKMEWILKIRRNEKTFN